MENQPPDVPLSDYGQALQGARREILVLRKFLAGVMLMFLILGASVVGLGILALELGEAVDDNSAELAEILPLTTEAIRSCELTTELLRGCEAAIVVIKECENALEECQ